LVTPVVIEFLAGVRGRHELELADKFLSEFAVLDDGNVVPSDWQEARRLARRVPQDGTRRQLGDCLIRAIANRLRADVLTLDEDFPG
jgi:predicted nucleic acid-binding protein